MKTASMYRPLRIGLIVLAGLLPSCARRLPAGLLTSRNTAVGIRRVQDAPEVQVTYLGAGGFYIRRGDDAILTAPFYSNPAFLRVLFRFPIRPRPDRIDHGLGGQIPGVDSADAILVGHSHYDHLMDLPYVAERWIQRGPIYGNRTMANLLASQDVASRLHVLNDLAGDSRAAGAWIEAGEHSRFMALNSSHAPHFMGVKLFAGRVTEPRKRLPRTAYGWREGQTFAFVIDFLREGAAQTSGVDAGGESPVIDFRIHYQDAASSPPAGFPPPTLLAERRVDLAIVTVGGFAQATDYPERILCLLAPRHVVLGHWEDFFRNPAKSPKVVRGTSLKKFIVRLKRVLPSDADWTLPAPGVTLAFAAGGDGPRPEPAPGCKER